MPTHESEFEPSESMLKSLTWQCVLVTPALGKARLAEITEALKLTGQLAKSISELQVK